MKKLLSLLLIFVFLFGAVACRADDPSAEATPDDSEVPACEHEWIDATCTTPKTCSVCNETEGEPNGHDWLDATCTEPKTCKTCGETQCEALGHDWDTDACGASASCQRKNCEATIDEIPHAWVNATLTAPKTCSKCQAMTLQYDDYFPSLLSIPATKEDVTVDGTALEIKTVDSTTYFHAKGIGEATLTDGEKSYTVIVEKAKINIVVVMGQSNSVNWEDSVSGSNLFVNAMTDISSPLGTAYHWNNTDKKPEAFTDTTRGLHSTLLAELYAQSVAAGDPVKNILISLEGSTSKSGQSISFWATPDAVNTPTLHTAKFLENCLAYYTKATNARKFSIGSKGMYWLQGEIDGSTNAHNAIPGHTAMDPATYEASFMKMWETLAAQGLEYAAFLRVRRDVEDNKFPNADAPNHNDLIYTTALSAQLKMIAEHDNFYLATSLTENWVGTADTEHTIDISNYLSVMNKYSGGDPIKDKDGNVIATVADGKLTTTMKDLYGSIAYCHYGKFGYTLIGADAAYNMYRALHGNSVAIVQGDTSGSPKKQTTATVGETKTINSDKLTEDLTFRAAAGSVAGTLTIKVMMDETDVTDTVMITEGAHAGALNAQKLKAYDGTTILVTYTLTDGTTHTVTYECTSGFGDIIIVG
ncbi:MAG: hypothetical protein IJD64_03685 [Clostridia bacterium]|nr:hypothetical protein [Clostridia bacterium]